MNLDKIIDFADDATEEVGKYILRIILSPKNLMTDQYKINNLNWDSVSYGEEELAKVPNDKRGIYAFVVCHANDVFPTHGYVLYIGIAGKDSNRSLRERYRDYLNERKVIKREGIARMIGHWHQVLRFYFAPVDDDISSEDLKELEQQLNSAFMPPFSKGDLYAKTKRRKRAFP